MINNVRQWLALNRLYGVNPSEVYNLVQKIPQSEDIFSLSVKILIQMGFSQALIDELKNIDQVALDRELEWAEKPNHHIVTLQDAHYPALLREISLPPLVLYVSGCVEDLNKPQLAMVGSRNATPIGEEIAYQFAQHLAKSGLIITSGLALGIDAATHRGALSIGHTVAVLGSGLQYVYPMQHKNLAEEITRYGAVISEFPLKTPPRKENFPYRNRVMSGLSLGVLVVEAAVRSGSLITARFAGEQGREVFAIPGSIHNPLARGCHQLIRKGAKLVETAQDVIEELGSLFNFVTSAQSCDGKIRSVVQESDHFDLDDDYVQLLSCVDYGMTPLDLIISRSGFSPKVISSMLLLLELQDYIKSVPGGYCKVASV
jgi:DNA processing protein